MIVNRWFLGPKAEEKAVVVRGYKETFWWDEKFYKTRSWWLLWFIN